MGRFSRAAGKVFLSVNFVEAECKPKAKCNVAYVPEVRAVQPWIQPYSLAGGEVSRRSRDAQATPEILSMSPSSGVTGTKVSLVVRRPPPNVRSVTPIL